MKNDTHVNESGSIKKNLLERKLEDYVRGAHHHKVNRDFALAIQGIGTREINLGSLTKIECKALTKSDLRWKIGPDGVKMWTEPAFTTRGEQDLANFNWLATVARIKWVNLNEARSDANACVSSEVPDWLEGWADAWSHWAFRYASVEFDNYLVAARGRNSSRAVVSAYTSINSRIEYIRAFLLDYMPSCLLGEKLDRWPFPEELLDRKNNDERSNSFRDEFWNIVCAPLGNEERSNERISIGNRPGARHSLEAQLFLDFIAEKLNASNARPDEGAQERYCCPFLPRTKSAAVLVRDHFGGYVPPLPRESDRAFAWIGREYPQLADWQEFACEYIQSGRNVTASLIAVSKFVGTFLATAGVKGEIGEQLPIEMASNPLEFLNKKNRQLVPNRLTEIAEQKSQARIYDFLEFILLRHCTFMDEGGVVRLDTHSNPFSAPEKYSYRNRPFETARVAMPYEWIRRFRRIIVEGPNFADWKWAQQAMKNPNGYNVDWFSVPPELVNENDPDCVWRERFIGKDSTRKRIVEIWSPARWVALVTKLITALRTSQVRMLDSGEADRMRFDLKAWARTSSISPLASNEMWTEQSLQRTNPSLAISVQSHAQLLFGKKRNAAGWSNGVLRPVRTVTPEGMGTNTVLYINTNKTADSSKHGAAKGFEAAMPVMECPMRIDSNEVWREPDFSNQYERRVWLDELGANIHWWLAKLRDWQEKYNPVSRLIEWSELSGRSIIPEKSDEQFASYMPACFLFREPARNTRGYTGNLYPVTDGIVQSAWWSLNKELQIRFKTEGKRNLDGTEIQLVVDFVGNKSRVCIFDLHSIRVSLITALVVDGRVPIEIVQRLVGHSRIIMTLFYTKINSMNMQKALAEGMKRLSEASANAERLFLQNANAEQIRNYSAYHDEASAFSAVGISMEPEDRKGASWTRVVGGYCPVGAVARNTESGLSAGCFNGGGLTGSKKIGISSSDYGPVTGGERACANCRWFITTPAHLPELMSMFEVTQYRVYEQDERAIVKAEELEAAIKNEEEAYDKHADHKRMKELHQEIETLENQSNAIAEQGISLKVTLGNIYRIIQRCLEIVNSREDSASGDSLVMVGGMLELGVILEETTSELLQLARISHHAEIYPELDPGKAVLKFSEIMAKKLNSDGIDPFMILNLTEAQRCKVTNAVMSSLAKMLEPLSDDAGLRAAVKVIEGPQSIASVLGIRPSAMGEFIKSCSSRPPEPMRLGVVGAAHTIPLAT